jgi:glycosyltransferase involved in cell wall biosynthesis
VKKIKNRAIFCSIPDRGLAELHAAWPLILKEVPDATLVITGDYRLWGLSTPNNHFHRLMWTDFVDSVHFLGKVSRKDLVVLQSEAEIMAYPCIYEELFCISAAECQVAGAYPVTSGFGALVTTNEFGTIISGDPHTPHFISEFTRTIVEHFTSRRGELEEIAPFMMDKAKERFSWRNIAQRWIRLFEEGHL